MNEAHTTREGAAMRWMNTKYCLNLLKDAGIKVEGA